MRQLFNIIRCAELLEQVGEKEAAKSIDSLVKEFVLHTNAEEMVSSFSNCLDRFKRRLESNYPSAISSDYANDFTMLVKLLSELPDKEWYDDEQGRIDLHFLVKNSTNQSVALTLINDSEYQDDIFVRDRMFSYRFFNNLRGARHDYDKFDSRAELELFIAELHNMQTKAFNKVFDRNFDAKSFETDFLIRYCPKGKKTFLNTNTAKWMPDNRIDSRFAKGLKKAPFRYTYSDRFWEQMNNYISSQLQVKGTFKIVSGEDIVKYYHQDTYDTSKPTASLENSCMRYSSCENFIEFYAINEGKISMLILIDEETDKIFGRALLWDDDSFDFTYMDRIYGSDLTVARFKKYAKENGLAHKYEQSYSNSTDWVRYDEDGNAIHFEKSNLHITLKNHDEYPYMDTFKYTDDYNGSTITLNNCDGCYTFNFTDGGNDDLRGNVCEISGERLDPDDEVCIGDYYYHVRYCIEDIHGNYILERDSKYLAYRDGYAYEDDCVYVSNEASNYYDEWILRDNATRVNGEWYHDDELYYDDIASRMLFCGQDGLMDITALDSSGISIETQIPMIYQDRVSVYVELIKGLTGNIIAEIRLHDSEVIYTQELVQEN